MDYLDRRKLFEQRVLLIIGYILVSVAIVIASLVLLYQSYGFNLGKNGTVVQNGLTFFSSHPSPASIYINGQLQSASTNTRLSLPSGIYNVKLTRSGYYDWQRRIEIQGGKVSHFDYPFLIPKTLTTKKMAGFTAAPGFMSQSPDHRWLLVQPPGTLKNFTAYDLKSPDKPPAVISLPDNLLSRANVSESWQLGEWADDNRHVLLQHVVDGKTEYMLVDREAPDQSLNLNATLAANPAKLTLSNRKFDHYYLYNGDGSLLTASLAKPTPEPLLTHVLAYKTYSDNTVLYVTDIGAPKGQTLVKLLVGNNTYAIRKLPIGTGYVLDLTQYSGSMYVAAGAASDNRVFVYKDPAGQLDANPGQLPVITQVLHVENVNYLSFSASAQFIVAENGTRFGVYDIENQAGYNYSTAYPLDPPQTHASWMDGNRLIYISGGKLLVFDYDNTNPHPLEAASAQYLPAFAPDFKYVYDLATDATGQYQLDQTWLLAPPDR